MIDSLPYVRGEPFATNVRVIYTYECSKCGSKEELISLGYTPNPLLAPDGWIWLGSHGGLWFCPKHKITITTENK